MTSNIRAFYGYVFMMSVQLFIPIVALYFQEVGLSYAEIMMLQSTFVVALFLLDVPTSIVADSWSRRGMLLVAAFSAVGGSLTFFLSRGFAGLFFGEILWGLSAASIRGTDIAYAYDSLAKYGPPNKDDLQKVLTNLTSLSLAATGLGSIAGALVAQWSGFSSVFFWNLPFFIGAIALAIVLKEIQSHGSGAHQKKAEPVTIARDAIGSLMQDQTLVVLVVDMAVLMAIARIANWYFQPVLRDSGLPVYSFGLVFALMNILSAAIVRISPRLDARLGSRGMMRGTRGFTALLLFALAWWRIPVLIIVVILALISVASVRRSLYSSYLSMRVAGGQTATVLSFAGMASSAVFVATGPLVGGVADRLGEPWAISALALGATAVTFLWRIPSPIQAPSQATGMSASG